jgi:hypothetical protein
MVDIVDPELSGLVESRNLLEIRNYELRQDPNPE